MLGEVAFSLDTQARTLTVDDNGTGMNQRIIEEHFLNVGSSRYRDESFRKQYPTFSAISRFGIGILSTFMISDEIEVVTKAYSDDKARNISIRSINGRYLIRRIDPDDDRVPALMKKHGTRIKLKLRAGVVLPQLKEIAELWILFPGCRVTVRINDDDPIEVGYASPRVALEAALRRAGLTIGGDPGPYTKAYRVIEKQKGGLTVAVALEWQPVFKTWGFATSDRLTPDKRQLPGNAATAVCIQGIRVESTTPGFDNSSILAISNITGPNAPITNVARSRIESGDHVEEMYQSIYAIYADHISSEIHELSTSRDQLISDAAKEGRYMLSPLQIAEASKQANASTLFNNALKTIPLLTIDREEQRSLLKLGDLEKMKGFWTVESSAYTSAENFVRSLPTGISISKLAIMSSAPMKLPNGDIVSGYAENARVLELLLEFADVDEIEILHQEKQVNFHWCTTIENRIWKSASPARDDAKQRFNHLYQFTGRNMQIRNRQIVLQSKAPFKVTGLEDEYGVKSSTRVYLLSGNEIHSYLWEYLTDVENGTAEVDSYVVMVAAIQWLMSEANLESHGERYRILESIRQMVVQQSNTDCTISTEFRTLFGANTGKIFDPNRGERQKFQWNGAWLE